MPIRARARHPRPPLPAGQGDEALAQVEAARALAQRCGLPVGQAVNFWTEASLFSDAGLTALVYGPGDIAQAHAADEWVEVDQLERVANTYVQLIDQALAERVSDDHEPSARRPG